MDLRRQIPKRVSLNRIEKLEFCQATPLLTESNDEVGGLTGVPGTGPSLRTNSPQLGGSKRLYSVLSAAIFGGRLDAANRSSNQSPF